MYRMDEIDESLCLTVKRSCQIQDRIQFRIQLKNKSMRKGKFIDARCFFLYRN